MNVKYSVALPVLVAVSAFAVAACSLKGASGTPIPGCTITYSGDSDPQIVRPLAGSSGVSIAAGTLAFPNTLPAERFRVDLAVGTSSVTLGTVMGAGQPPPGGGTVPLVSLPYPALAANTTYTVEYVDLSSDCAELIGGSFTTQ